MPCASWDRRRWGELLFRAAEVSGRVGAGAGVACHWHRQPHRPQIPERLCGLRRQLLPEGYPEPGLHLRDPGSQDGRRLLELGAFANPHSPSPLPLYSFAHAHGRTQTHFPMMTFMQAVIFAPAFCTDDGVAVKPENMRTGTGLRLAAGRRLRLPPCVGRDVEVATCVIPACNQRQRPVWRRWWRSTTTRSSVSWSASSSPCSTRYPEKSSPSSASRSRRCRPTGARAPHPSFKRLPVMGTSACSVPCGMC